MRAIMLRYATSAGLLGVLTIGVDGSWLRHVQAGGEEPSQIAQYCVPHEQDPGSQRIFCHERG
jgi:hypothetical protein